MDYKQNTRNEYRNCELHVACIGNSANKHFEKMMSRTLGHRYYQYVKQYDAKFSGYYNWAVYQYRVGKLGTSKVHYYIFRYQDESTRDAHVQVLQNYYHDLNTRGDFRILSSNKGSLQIQAMFDFESINY